LSGVKTIFKIWWIIGTHDYSIVPKIMGSFLIETGEIKCFVNGVTESGSIHHILHSIESGNDVKQEDYCVYLFVKLKFFIFD
jgi:predicted Zn-dependent protease